MIRLHADRVGGQADYWVGDAGLWIWRDGANKDRWKVDVVTRRAGEWVRRNQPDLPQLSFATRREAVQLLQALRAVDPLPSDPLLPESALQHQDDGTYLMTDYRGDEYVVSRTADSRWRWLVRRTGDKNAAPQSFCSLWVIRMNFAEPPGTEF